MHETSQRTPPCLERENTAKSGESVENAAPANGGARPTAPRQDELASLIEEWFHAYLGQIVWSTLERIVTRPSTLTRDWWQHRRDGLMSPVRALVSVVLLGTVLSWVQRLAYPRGEASLGSLIEVFVWQSAVVVTLTTVVVLSVTLPKRLQRSRYQHAVFALYECTFVCLVVWSLALVLLSSALWPAGLSGVGYGLSSLILPGAVGVIMVHATRHLRDAYELSWIGAALRVVAVAAASLFAGLFVSFLLIGTGIAELWSPVGPETMPVFTRE